MNKPLRAEALRWAQAQLRSVSPAPVHEALDLLAWATGQTPAQVLTANTVSSASDRRFRRAVRQRATGRPFAYILGWQPFCGLKIKLTPATLIPRPATEELVATILSDWPNQAQSVVDVGTGSGCIALALAAARPTWQIIGTDISTAALRAARRNARQLKLPVTFQSLTPNHLSADLLVANLPYVPSHQIASDLRHEPRLALDGGPDGLRVIKQFFRLIQAPPQALYLECLAAQVSPIRRLVRDRWPRTETKPLGYDRGRFGLRVSWPPRT